MLFENTKTLEFNQYQKYYRLPFFIYRYLKCVIEEIHGYKSNPENSSTTKVNEHIPSGFPKTTISSFRSIKNRHDVYRDKNCMKTFCEFLRKHAMKIINLKKKKIKLLTIEQPESYANAKICKQIHKKSENRYKKYRQIRYNCHYTGFIEVLRIPYVI